MMSSGPCIGDKALSWTELKAAHPGAKGFNLSADGKSVISLFTVAGKSHDTGSLFDRERVAYMKMKRGGDKQHAAMRCSSNVALYVMFGGVGYFRGLWKMVDEDEKHFFLVPFDSEEVEESEVEEVDVEEAVVVPLMPMPTPTPESAAFPVTPPRRVHFAPVCPPQLKRVRRTSADRARPTEYEGVQYKSLLEARTASLMHKFDIAFEYEDGQLNLQNVDADGKVGETYGYSPDFWLPDQGLYLEIKPAFPHLEEMLRCEQVGRKGHAIALVYGMELGVPTASEAKGRAYTFKNAQRGMMWDRYGKRVAGDVCWAYDADTDSVTLQVVSSVSEYERKCLHPMVLEGMASVNQQWMGV